MTIRELIELKLKLTLESAINDYYEIRYKEDEEISNTVLNLVRALNELNDEEVDK